MSVKFDIKHENFIKNKVELEVLFYKNILLYNCIPVKTKRGKATIIDDNGNSREIKIVDLIFKIPVVSIDNADQVIYKLNSKIFYFCLVPSILFFYFGLIGAVLGVFNVRMIRNLFISNKPIATKIALSLALTASWYVIVFAIALLIESFVV